MRLLSELTTLRVGGPAVEFVAAQSEAELIDAVCAADDAGVPLLVIGGGSNLVVADAGFAGVVVRDARTGVATPDDSACAGVSVTAVAGQDWDELVATAVENNWVGIEALSGIPGTVGAAPVQNIGAYGAEIAGVLSNIRTWDRAERCVRTFAVGELELGYRSSLLKRSMLPVPQLPGSLPDVTKNVPIQRWHPTPRYVVLDVTLQMRYGLLGAQVAYAELARALGVEVGARVPMSDIRQAVLELRAAKGMLALGRNDVAGFDMQDPDRQSAGSFFTNPILATGIEGTALSSLPPEAPRYPVRFSRRLRTNLDPLGDIDSTRIKTSAAWLIEHAGFIKGFGVHGPGSPATLSTKHTLALTNRGSATAADIVELAQTVRDGVQRRFGITLTPEPVLVGVTL